MKIKLDEDYPEYPSGPRGGDILEVYEYKEDDELFLCHYAGRTDFAVYEYEVEVVLTDAPPATVGVEKITAVCEIHDQCTGIEEVRIIDYTEEAMSAFEEEMEERMGWLGYRISFYPGEMPDYDYDQPVYRWMDANSHLEIDRPI